MKDYYKILGVDKNTPKEEIKKAYRKLAHKHHPDKNGGNDEEFKRINEAYYVLGDDKRKSDYDRFGAFPGGPGGFQGQSDFGFEEIWKNFGGTDGFSFGGGGNFADIFEGLFGFGFPGSARQSSRGRDISIDIMIPFSEAIFGTTRRILLNKNSVCRVCRGSGASSDSGTERCVVCSGSGTVRESRRSVFGIFTGLSECKKCKGRGEVIKNPCKSCRGEGIARKEEEEVEVAIPAGINNGEMLRVTGAGEAKRNGLAGDLYVKIYVEPHARFRRESNDLISEIEVSLTDALLGSEKSIEALDGKIKIQIPQGVDSGDVLRVRGRGVPKQRGGRGDLLFKVKIKNPKKLSKNAKELIEELKKEGL